MTSHMMNENILLSFFPANLHDHSSNEVDEENKGEKSEAGGD